MLQSSTFEIAHTLEAEPVHSALNTSGLLTRLPQVTPLNRPAIIGNFPPRQCGLATFTRDMYTCLSQALPMARWSIIAMTDPGSTYAYPAEVSHEVPQNDREAYRALADTLNANGTDVLFVQHEFGIYGGPSGAWLIDCLEALNMPIITTLHTILEDPSPEQRTVMQALIRLSSTLVTMAQKGAQILKTVYGVPNSQISIVPHGAPARPLRDTASFKTPLNLSGRKTLTTFGLLSPNKGIETIIAGLPRLRLAHPDIIYLIIGATHPHLLRGEGEAYRDKLKAMARDLGVEDNVRFINRFINDNDLIDILQATDVYVTPYLTETQITSGTLSYALALGRPVVSTPYWHAVEALSDGIGVLCPFHDTDAFTRAISGLLDSDKRRSEMSASAYVASQSSRWPAVAQAYVTRARADIAHLQTTPPKYIRALSQPLSWQAVTRMTDDCGLFQHGKYRLPDRQHGYCADDNARALSFTARLSCVSALTDTDLKLAYTYAAFTNHAWNPEGRFRNFMSYGRDWLDNGGSDDCCARNFEALVDVATSRLPLDMRLWATELGGRVLAHIENWTSLRARAAMIKNLYRALGVMGDKAMIEALIRRLSLGLHQAFKTHAQSPHIWFEPGLSYDNSRLPEGLIIGGHVLKDSDMLRDGVRALRWLMTQQTHKKTGRFLPVPTSQFCQDGQDHPIYDQQPLEVLATIDACLTAAQLTADPGWHDEALRAFAWFHGENSLGLSLLDGEGGCFDGLTPNGCNENQGAESILAYPLSWMALKAAL